MHAYLWVCYVCGEYALTGVCTQSRSPAHQRGLRRRSQASSSLPLAPSRDPQRGLSLLQWRRRKPQGLNLGPRGLRASSLPDSAWGGGAGVAVEDRQMDSQLSRQLGPPAKWAAKSTGPEIGEGPAAAACLLVLGADFQPAGGGVTPGLAGPAPPHCLPGSGSVLSSWAWKEHPQGGGGGATSLADPTLPAPRGWGQRCEPLSAACPPPLSASPTHCPVFTPQSPAPQGPGRAPGDAAEGVGAAPRGPGTPAEGAWGYGGGGSKQATK